MRLLPFVRSRIGRRTTHHGTCAAPYRNRRKGTVEKKVGTTPFSRLNWTLLRLAEGLWKTRDHVAYPAHIVGSMSRVTLSGAEMFRALTRASFRRTLTSASPLVTMITAWVTKDTPRGSGLSKVTVSLPCGEREITWGGAEKIVCMREGVIARRRTTASPIAKPAVRKARAIEDFAMRYLCPSLGTCRISRSRRYSPTNAVTSPIMRPTSMTSFIGRKNGLRLAPSLDRRAAMRTMVRARMPAYTAFRIRRIRGRRSAP
jgi:hypothetical protein